MGKLIAAITKQGALFEAKVMASPQRVAWLKAHNHPYPPPLVVKALVDTGASNTCIDSTIVTTLKLDPAGSTAVHTPSTMGTAVNKNTYDVSVTLGEGQSDPRTYTLELIETDLLSQGFELLIGRDILSKCILNYHGPNGMCDLLF